MTNRAEKQEPAWAEMGRRMKDDRTAHGYTQKQLAAVLQKNGVPLGGTALGNWERGRRRVTYDAAVVFERLFGRPAAYYLCLLTAEEARLISAMRSPANEK